MEGQRYPLSVDRHDSFSGLVDSVMSLESQNAVDSHVRQRRRVGESGRTTSGFKLVVGPGIKIVYPSSISLPQI
jgi:hypothetical protein